MSFGFPPAWPEAGCFHSLNSCRTAFNLNQLASRAKVAKLTAGLSIILMVASALKSLEFNPPMSGHRETLWLAKSKLSSLGRLTGAYDEHTDHSFRHP
jgi:hypothetical protein